MSLRALLYQLLALLTVFSLGYLIAQQQHITTPNLSSTSLQTGAPTRQLFAYNRTFSSPPSNTTNQAWIDLFPAHHGFFVHPTLAPNLSVVAVFHQLHCVDVLRHGYYTASGAAMDPEASTAGVFHHGDPAHVRHCLDYLRQAIMCHADLNFEPVVPELGGARGFGVEHTCGNYEGVLDWVAEWE